MAFRETSSLLRSFERIETLDERDKVFGLKKFFYLPLLLLIPFLLWLLLFDQGITIPPTPNENETNNNLLQLGAVPPEPYEQIISSDYVGPSPEVSIELGPVPKLKEGVEINIPPAPQNQSIVKFQLNITHGKLAPDNTNPQNVYFINNQFPGPILRIPQNSKVEVEVLNNLPNTSLTIHFHGIHQRGTFLSDGVPLVTQDPIPPGGSFVHKFNTWPQAGTFFYHAHTGLDMVWIAAPIIIEDDPWIYKSWPEVYQYDEDKVILINGLYKPGGGELNTLVEKLLGPIHSYPDIYDTTINGKTYGVANNSTMSKKRISLDITRVDPSKKYRFRFINAATDGIYECRIPSHNFTIIEMDGIYTVPVESDTIVISGGQRYSIIVQMDKTVDNYFILCTHLEVSGPIGVGVINYAGANIPPTRMNKLRELLNQHNTSIANLISEKDRWNSLDQLTPNFDLNQTDVYRVPAQVDKEFMIDTVDTNIGEKRVYLINGHLFVDPEVSYHKQLRDGINITKPPQVFEFKKGDVVQIIFNNQRFRSTCFAHPWHIHGHTFYVVGDGPNRFNPDDEEDRAVIDNNIRMNKRMQFRDTVTVLANQTIGNKEDAAYCGWTAVRFVANNPGLWLAHCHVTPHMLMGKRFVMWEHDGDENDPFLKELMV